MPPRTLPASREQPLVPEEAALLVVDVQRYCCDPAGGMFNGLARAAIEARFGDYLRRLQDSVLPNLQQALAACRATGVEVLYTYIEALTADGRDQSLDYRLSGIFVPRGSPDAAVMPAIAPAADDILLPKTASSVFNATHIDYVLRNLGVKQLVIAGVLTEQCVESAVRDACDRGYLVTLLSDACASITDERHAQALKTTAGYCRQRKTAELLAELTESPRE